MFEVVMDDSELLFVKEFMLLEIVVLIYKGIVVVGNMEVDGLEEMFWVIEMIDIMVVFGVSFVEEEIDELFLDIIIDDEVVILVEVKRFLVGLLLEIDIVGVFLMFVVRFLVEEVKVKGILEMLMVELLSVVMKVVFVVGILKVFNFWVWLDMYKEMGLELIVLREFWMLIIGLDVF